MTSTFYSEKLDFQSKGYHAVPTTPDDPTRLQDIDIDLWVQVEEITDRARLGDFSRVHELLYIYRQAHGRLQDICIHVLSDAGTRSCFQEMAKDLKNPLVDFTRSADFSLALIWWGNLSIVPIVLWQYEILYMSEEQETIPCRLSDLLEPEQGPIGDRPARNDEAVEVYSAMVMKRYQELTDQFGTDDVFLFKGEIFGVVPIAKLILNRLGDSHADSRLQPILRQKFEASTGVDCSVFYKDRKFQPLVAAATVEEFLESPEAQRYQHGVRYFFGHRIPD